ncbi:LOW QUALITY PROTEIN: laminin subunit alpha-5-like [Acipenser ruthenus]|uniref:LOW QUALITY PROTEIN: laminin subunit alpha-5-like n=1 Tax=Acipenser ruthenus TaxID=7906 RepID=UPI002740E364|nr:LOW QUALITY PROTEIN: laminin subunit alpha-5-like [Acipenser ruthenus]
MKMAKRTVELNGTVACTACFLVILSTLSVVSGQTLPTNGVNGFSLHPPYFNLAEGTKITATATCGEDGNGKAIQDLYCKLVGGPVSGDPSQTIQGQYCDTCRAGDSDRAHPITNAIDGTERWWQSPPLSRSLEYNEVNVTLDLGQLFHVAYVLIKFANSPRPDLWVLERSINFGDTYQPWQYFASSKRDCIERFGPRTIERITNDNDVICTSEYSRIVPLENGEIVVSLVNGRPGAMNFSYSPVLRNFTKATNIRLRFLRTNTLLGHLMGKALRDPTVTRRYYYSIKDISIGGRCVCNGHAEACDAKDPTNPYRLQCDCQHNTCGGSCDQCCPGYNQMPWKPATTDNANECEPCNCNNHSFDCYYDPEVDRRKASVDINGRYLGGGFCMECQHHTTGINCERCIPGYYRSPDHPVDSPFACAACACDSEFTDGTCEDLTGRCYCKPNFTGENCASCAEGYTGFPVCYPVSTYPNTDNGELLPPAGSIINCECNAAGTEGNLCRPDPRNRICVCKPNFEGVHCDQCIPRHFGLNCQPCQCSGPGVFDGGCNAETGQCFCRSGFQGYLCDQCAPGYFNYPLCQLCGCSTVGSVPEGCDPSGRCLCKPEFTGPRCEQCKSGFHSYPNCQVCSCDPRGSAGNGCSPAGHCQCRPNFTGPTCDQCAPGYYGYPSCTACQCSIEGSRHSSCNQETGQCNCLANVGGQHCDSCAHGAYGFPLCQVGSCNPDGSIQNGLLPSAGSCNCRPYVQGAACDTCKPLYWNLTPDNPYGCTSCRCSTEGTISSVAECSQGNGQCFCKPNVCSRTCSVCKDGYNNLERTNFFGCQGCQCDIGGSIGLTCDDRTGRCQCRKNVEGLKCNQPKRNHYFPDLHHLKFEIEDGTMMDGRPVRFNYNPLEFEAFSWRGYAQMSSIQPRVVVAFNVSSPDLFHIVFRYVNRGTTDVKGRVSVLEEGKHVLCSNCSDQSKQIIFAPGSEPSFVTVPQNSFVEPFVLNPGTWSIIIEAQDILLDFLVLLPSAYYEAPVLQLKVTEACKYKPSPEEAKKNCLLYKYLSLDGFLSAPGVDGTCRSNNHLPRRCQSETLTPRHPPMAICSGNDINVQLKITVPRPSGYVLVVEYANEDESSQTLSISVNTPGRQTQQESIILYSCKYSFLCRGVAVDSKNRVAVFGLTTEGDVQFIADRANFFLYKVYLIPHEEFTMEYVEPKMHCISTHGTFSPDSGAFIPSRFQTPSQSTVLKDGLASLVPEAPLLSMESQVFPADRLEGPQQVENQPRTAVDNPELTRLDGSQNAVVYLTRVQTLGRYAFILHFYQPNHPTFPVQVYLNGGRIWQGEANATFCPHGFGCRSLMISENQIILDVTDNEVFITIKVPRGKTVWLDYVLVVPEASYSSNYLVEEPLDKSYDFISHCGANSFYINPTISTPFCRESAISLSVFYNNGALPCGCHEAGRCEHSLRPLGGKCNCRPNVIGRDCSRCVTGYWGFPNCRPCQCGTRLCNEVTGQCICPPRTVKPECTICEPQTFGCHPLVGCEECNCSRSGVSTLTDMGCNIENGQCKCKDKIIGRQCDRCAAGFYGYPNCRQCECSEAGTEDDICDSVTGQCHCKENVEGPRCGQCRVGTFHLDPANPKGCTSCFCFGATDRCRSSDKRRTQTVDMNGWVLLSGERQELAVSVSPERGLVEADLRDVPDVYQELHWHAPQSYHGDRVSSYGGFLRYRLHSQSLPIRGDVAPPPLESARPDVILKGNKMTLVYQDKSYPDPGQLHEGNVHLIEGNFRHAQTRNSVSREELMMVLVGLEVLQIRALHSQSSVSVSLERVVLEGASQATSGSAASNVEICMCPANYRGESCQECAPGFYRDTKGLFLGKCVPCNCNGHSDECLPGSGICVNCQHNTEGNHCETCRNGFLGNSTAGQTQSCTGCPCPLQVSSNNFAIGCVERSSSMQCLCMPGYAGPKCERCAPGFYGNPMVIGSSCQPCQCNGNTDANMLFSDCDSLMGVCIGCMHNTAGPHCEICAPGYFGDAIIAKNCTNCNCSPCGTASCDPRTGQCQCKPGVTGARCDRCKDGFYGYDSCTGCQRCDCDSAAALTQACNPQNGQCSCQPGVSGPQCLQCAPGFWGYTSDGCTRCDCKGGSCNPRSGECTCSDGLTGKQCDSCLQKLAVPVVNGQGSLNCQTCDSCVVVLLDDLDSMKGLFPVIRDQLTNLNASSIAWGRLRGLDESIDSVTNKLYDYKDVLDDNKQKVDELENEDMNLSQDLDMLEERAALANRKVHKLEDNIAATRQRAEDLIKHIGDIMKAVQDGIGLVNKTSANETHSTEDLRKKLSEMEKLLRQMRDRAFCNQKKLAEDELKMAKDLLGRVDNDMAKRSKENDGLVDDIRDQLTKYNTELMDLRDALNEAVNQTAQVEDLNNRNENLLDESRKKNSDLQRALAEVKGLLTMAEDALFQVTDLLQMLEDSKEDYEKLAANLDGARKRLLEKVQKFASASTKIPLVEEAERHAELLHQLSKNLSSVIQDTNQDGFIQRAINASNAYSSIIEAVRNAENAAKKADEAATNALENVKNEDLGEEADRLKKKSNALLEDAKNVQTSLNDLKPQLKEAKKRLQDAKDKKEQLLKDLKDAQSMLNIDKGNTEENIKNAKAAAEDAKTKAENVERTLNPIKEKLDQWKDQYGNSSGTNEDFKNAFKDANSSVLSLGDTIPLLIKKLDKLQSRSTQMPNISENIERIRDLISQARNAASKVSVPMKFDGTSGVQLRNPNNLLDVAPYTSLKFYISLLEGKKKRQTESEKQFVFYLGNKDATKGFLGMSIEGKKLKWFFNVGGQTAELLNEQTISTDAFNMIKLERILQYGQMSVTVDKTTSLVTKGNTVAGGDEGLLTLTPSDTVFYVGGYPPDFLPPPELRLSKFQGCIEMDSLNEEVISLYNFENNFMVDTVKDRPCGRKKSVTEPWINDGSYFDGSGFAAVEIQSGLPGTSRFEQEVKVLSYNGILFFLEGEGHFICIAVKDGDLKLYYDFNGELKEAPIPNTDLKISDAKSKGIQIILREPNGNMKVYVRLERKMAFNVEHSGSPLNFSSVYYIGGVPEEILPNKLKPLFPNGGSIKGCVRSIKAIDKYIDLKRMNTTGVSHGCSPDFLVARTARFTGNGYLDLSLDNVPSLLNNFYSGFGFRTSQSNGLLFYHKTTVGHCQVLLENSRLVVNSNSGAIKTKNLYSDDMNHYVALYINKNGVRLYVDNILEGSSTGRRKRHLREVVLEKFYLGGAPDATLGSNLTGCISNMFVKRENDEQMVVDFLQSSLVQVSLNCPSSREPQQIRALVKKNKMRSKATLKASRNRIVERSCRSKQPKIISGAFQFSGFGTSRLEFSNVPESFRDRSHFSMDVRLNSSSGLLFYVSNEKENSLMALSVSSGRLVLLVSIAGKKLKTRSREKYNDGQWHTVFFSREKNRVHLVTDGLKAQTGTLSSTGQLLVNPPFYVGGVPAGKGRTLTTELSVSGFVGCIKNLKLDGKSLDPPSSTFGVGPCSESSLEDGVYFAAGGGHLALDNSFAVGQDFEMMLEVRPVTDTGLLFHIGKKRHYLTLYAENGEVTIKVNNGGGEFSASVIPEQSLCNGRWHHIAVIKRNNVIQLDVDTEGKHAVGPTRPHSSSTKEMLYLGGVPDTVDLPGLSSPRPSFYGCVRNLVINQSPVHLSRAGAIYGAVGVGGCPVM